MENPKPNTKIPDDQHDIQQDESRISKVLKRIFIIFIAVFMIFLIVSYILYSNGLGIIIQGQISSYKLANNEIALKGENKIIFQDGSYEELLKIYYNNQEHEFKACLLGGISDGIYYINSVAIPKTFSQTFSSVTAEPCTNEAIISLHSHPYKSCFFSLHDISTYRHVKAIREDAMMAIMCEPDRFNFYRSAQ
jgi:hypothetical protein